MARTRGHHHHRQQQQSRVLYDLSSLLLKILRYPPSPSLSSLNFADHFFPSTPSPSSSSSGRLPPQITPAGFASLMLGISLALMLCGSVTFFIGFLLLPWVIGVVMVFYFVGLVTSISVLGRTFLCYALATSAPPSPSSPRKDIPAWNFM